MASLSRGASHTRGAVKWSSKDAGTKFEENINVFKSDNFDADTFVQSKSQSLNEKLSKIKEESKCEEQVRKWEHWEAETRTLEYEFSSGAVVYIQKEAELESTMEGFVVAMSPIGATVITTCSGTISDSIGRHPMLNFSSEFYFLKWFGSQLGLEVSGRLCWLNCCAIT